MNAKNNWFEKNNLRIFLLFFVAGSFIYLDNFNQKYFKNTKAVINDIVGYSGYALTWPIKEALNIPGYIINIATLEKENDQLIDLQEQTKKLIAENRFLKQESQKFQRFIQEEEMHQNRALLAKVILKTNRITADTMTINKGAGDGVKIGNPVTKNNNLIGQIAEVNYKSSRVMLLSDINSNIPILVGKLQVQAILTGNPASKKKFDIEYLPKKFKLTNGDFIYTSSIDGILKKGILVGVISDTEYDETTKKQNYKINFNYKIHQTDYVSVSLN